MLWIEFGLGLGLSSVAVIGLGLGSATAASDDGVRVRGRVIFNSCHRAGVRVSDSGIGGENQC